MPAAHPPNSRRHASSSSGGLDCLLREDAPRRPRRTPDEAALGDDHIAAVTELSEEDLNLVASFIDALVTKTRLKVLHKPSGVVVGVGGGFSSRVRVRRRAAGPVVGSVGGRLVVCRERTTVGLGLHRPRTVVIDVVAVPLYLSLGHRAHRWGCPNEAGENYSDEDSVGRGTAVGASNVQRVNDLAQRLRVEGPSLGYDPLIRGSDSRAHEANEDWAGVWWRLRGDSDLDLEE